MLHRRKALKESIIGFDWLGLAIYFSSALTFLMGITGEVDNIRGKVHMLLRLFWQAPLVLLLWEAYLPIKGTYPFPPYACSGMVLDDCDHIVRH